MRNVYFFLVGLLISTAWLIPYKAHAALNLTPSVVGYVSAAGRYSAAASSVAMTAANDGYIAQAVVNVAGKAVTIPATLRMAANAGQIALVGARLSPVGIAGTLLAGWLLEKYLQPDGNGGWNYVTSNWCYQATYRTPACSSASDIATSFSQLCGSPGCATVQPFDAGRDCVWYYGSCQYIINQDHQVSGSRPATQSDWDALPDPLPVIAPELPYAPYLPEGAPVTVPEYAPSDVPLGNPYTKPDGSTAQPRAKISPSGDGQVTVSTYDQPLTDAQGQPVANPTPQPTPDQQQTDCDKKPGSVGCTDLGTPPPGEAMPRTEKAITFAPVSIASNATCPAPITTTAFGESITIPYDSICTYASGLKPVVIAVGYITALFIIFGVPRSAQS